MAGDGRIVRFPGIRGVLGVPWAHFWVPAWGRFVGVPGGCSLVTAERRGQRGDWRPCEGVGAFPLLCKASRGAGELCLGYLW